jgi:hypothetical protein
MSEAEAIRNESVAVEQTDVSPRLVALLAGGVAGFVALAILALALVYPSALRGRSDAPRSQPATPRLQVDPVRDLAVYRAAEQQQLRSYGWVDRAHGIVRIPIEQAMREVAGAGIKDWPKAP